MVALVQPPTWLQNGAYSARLDRNLVDLFFTEGVIAPGAGNFEVTATSPTSNSVAIAAGRAVITGDDEANQGKYLCVNESTLNLILNSAPPANSRIDLVYLRVNDPVAGGPAGNNATIEFVEGTAAPMPVAPATPTTAIPLAQILRTAGDTSITAGMITDVRPTSSGQTFTVRSNFEIVTTAERNALVPYPGESVFDSDDSIVYTWDGSNWVAMGIPAVTTAQRNALTPYTGLMIYNTDLPDLEFWTGSAWDLVNTPVPDPIPMILALS